MKDNDRRAREWMIALFAAGYPTLIIGLFALSDKPNWVGPTIAGGIPVFAAFVIAYRFKIKW